MAVLAMLGLLASSGTALARFDVATVRRAVVKLYVTVQPEDYAMPWQGGRPSMGSGTGFITAKRRILTNAHVVSNARFIEVQKDGHPGRFPARITFIGHDCDMAALTVDDPAFFENTRALSFAKRMPGLNDDVYAVGYPTGGERISITRGIVSRIDYGNYVHSGVDHHLVMQVDAAINPGNSGGPILYKGRVAAVAFQGLSRGDNIGYGIPLPVMNHFLDDIADGVYHGYPELGVHFLPTRNAALRRRLGLDDDGRGVAIHTLDPFGSASGRLQAGDVLLAIDGLAISSDGNIPVDDNHVLFTELLERRQWGEEITFRVRRGDNTMLVRIPLTNPADPFSFRTEYDQRPEYMVLGGLVFSPLSRNYMFTQRREADNAAVQQLHYLMSFAKTDGLHEGRDQFVVLIARLPHAVNTYAGDFVNAVVSEVNGTAIGNLRDLAQAVAQPVNGFHVVRFLGRDSPLILDAEAARHATDTILSAYSVDTESFIRPPGGSPP